MTADDVATVQRFAKLRKIDYPLLSDTNRDVINAFGLFNDRFPEGSRYRGTAIPMVVVINAFLGQVRSCSFRVHLPSFGT